MNHYEPPLTTINHQPDGSRHVWALFSAHSWEVLEEEDAELKASWTERFLVEEKHGGGQHGLTMFKVEKNLIS